MATDDYDITDDIYTNLLVANTVEDAKKLIYPIFEKLKDAKIDQIDNIYKKFDNSK